MFHVYANASYIEICGDEEYCLSIQSNGWVRIGPQGLAALEEILFEFATDAMA